MTKPTLDSPERRPLALPATVAAAVLLLVGCSTDDGGGSRNLVLISLDTVRQDHLPTYGYPRDTAPAVDALADGAVVFERAFAQDTNTNPSHTSMFTGVYPHVHGNQSNGLRLAPAQVTLAQILQHAGFRTAGFVSAVTMLARYTGLERGFEIYDDRFTGKRRDGRVAAKAAVEWLRAREPDERFFLFLHLYDAHGPYTVPAPYDAMFRSTEPGPYLERIPKYQVRRDPSGAEIRDLNDYVDRYDGGIRYADDCLASVLAELDLDRTLVVVLADHGETLGERYWTLDHGGQLFDEQVHIPLILRAPGIAPRRVDSIVETVDLLPTLLDLLGVDRPANRPVSGRNLAPFLRGEASLEDELAFASARAEDARHADRGYRLDTARRLHAVRSADWKLVLYPGVEADYLELFDLDSDPGERADVIGAFPRVGDTLRERLEGWMVGAEAVEVPELDATMREQFEALGYVGDEQED